MVRSKPGRFGGLTWRRAISSAVLSASYLLFGMAVDCNTSALAAQARKQPKKEPKRETRKPAAAPQAPAPLSPTESLGRALSAESQKNRIALLEKFIAANKGSTLEPQAREALMREYALSGEQHLREGAPQLAAKDFKSILRLAPDPISDRIFGQYLFPLPVAMNAFGYRVESVDLMKSFEPRFEADANRLVQIGFFYVQIEAPLEAVRVLERTAQLAPSDHRVRNSLGTAYLINLRLDDAAAEFEKALELDPRDEFANLNLANLARSVGEHERAVRYYKKQLEIKRDDAEARGGLAISLLALGRDEEATPEIKQAMQLAPENYRFYVQLAHFYVTRRKPGLARPLIERAAQIEPRYAWTSIVKANADALESKFGDALATIISAQNLARFPTLSFELVKALIALDGYDQAVDAINKTFTITPDGEYEAVLGGVIKARSPRIDLLLERERQASLFLNESSTTSMQFKLAESLGRIEHFTKVAVSSRKPAEASTGRRRARGQGERAQRESSSAELQSATRPRRARESAPSRGGELSAGRDANLPGAADLMRAITIFTSLDDGRQAFRMVWASRRLAENNLALDAAEQLARRALDMAEAATEPEGSMRDTPLLDREGRRAVFLGRAHDALGWALLKKGDTRGALEHLAKAVEFYPPSLERKGAIWHLAVAMEEAGEERRALDLYISSYEPSTSTSSARRAQIESLYKKLNGSLAGLEEKLKNQ